MVDYIDFSNTGMEPVADGTYAATVSKMELKQSKAGNPMIKVEFTLSDEPYEGRKLFDNLSLLQNSLWATKRSLLRMGGDKETLSGRMTRETLQELCGSLIGNDVMLKVTIVTRADNGEDSNDVEVVESDSVFGF
jgi:hypothetical protein